MVDNNRFVTAAAYAQYEYAVEGLGTAEPGLYDQTVGDVVDLVVSADPTVPAESHARALGLDANRTGRALRQVGEIREALGGAPWSRRAALDKLRSLESGFATRRTDFFRRHPVTAPYSQDKTARLAASLEPLSRGGGVGWRQACRIAAESAVVGEERGVPVTLVAEGGPLASHGTEIRSRSGLTDIVDLTMASHCRR